MNVMLGYIDPITLVILLFFLGLIYFKYFKSG